MRAVTGEISPGFPEEHQGLRASGGIGATGAASGIPVPEGATGRPSRLHRRHPGRIGLSAVLWAAVASCAGPGFVPTATPPAGPAGTSTAEPPRSATVLPEEFLTWATYDIPQLGVAIEYPVYFGLPPYSSSGCQPSLTATEDGSAIHIGLRLWITTSPFDPSALSLADYVEGEIARIEESGEVTSEVEWGTIGGVTSATLEYRFGGANRYGASAYFVRGDTLFTASVSAGGSCGDLAYAEGHQALDEFDAFSRLFETFRFTE
jgi:hypothetical protein